MRFVTAVNDDRSLARSSFLTRYSLIITPHLEDCRYRYSRPGSTSQQQKNVSPNCNVKTEKDRIELMRKSQPCRLDRQYEINKQPMSRDAQLTQTRRGAFSMGIVCGRLKSWEMPKEIVQEVTWLTQRQTHRRADGQIFYY